MGKKGSIPSVILLAVFLTACTGPRFAPLTADNCRVRADLIAGALGVEMTVEEAAAFTDPRSGDSGTACQISAEGTGMAVADFWAAAGRLHELFSFDWQDDPAYAADGPTGSAGAYRKWNAICLWEAGWQPTPGAECPPDQPIATCDLPPEQVQYHFMIRCALDHEQEGQ